MSFTIKSFGENVGNIIPRSDNSCLNITAMNRFTNPVVVNFDVH
jgi:hypothetical protein